MKLLSLKSFSLLGLLLLVASVVIAALNPSMNKKTKLVNGVLAFGETSDTHTCILADVGPLNCHDTKSDGIFSTSSGVFSSTTVTAGNTTTGDAI